jgi:hypothetical protein
MKVRSGVWRGNWQADDQPGPLEMSNWEGESVRFESRVIYLEDTIAWEGAGGVGEDTMSIELGGAK